MNQEFNHIEEDQHDFVKQSIFARKHKSWIGLTIGTFIGFIGVGLNLSKIDLLLLWMFGGLPNPINIPFYLVENVFNSLFDISLIKIITHCVSYGDDCAYSFKVSIYGAITWFVISVLLGFFIGKKKFFKGIVYAFLAFLGILVIVWCIINFIIFPQINDSEKFNLNNAKNYINNLDAEITKVIANKEGYYSKIEIPEPPEMSNGGPNDSENWHIFRIYTRLYYQNDTLSFVLTPVFASDGLLKQVFLKNDLPYKRWGDDVLIDLNYSSKYNIEIYENGIELCDNIPLRKNDNCYLLIKNLGKSSDGRVILLLTMSSTPEGDSISDDNQ